MKTNLFFVACCVLLLQRSQAQSGFPTVLQLLFDQVASDYNTCNEKGMPMGFVSGFVVDGDAAFLAKQGIEIMFNPQMGVKREGCDLMRWDPVLLAWGRFEGNSLRNAREGGSLYWSSKVNAPGVYALLKDLKDVGNTTLQLPKDYRVEKWKYVQQNAGIVCEGFTKGTLISVPLSSLSPLAEISMKVRTPDQQFMAVDYTPVGLLSTNLWHDVNALNASHSLTFADAKK